METITGISPEDDELNKNSSSTNIAKDDGATVLDNKGLQENDLSEKGVNNTTDVKGSSGPEEKDITD